MSQKISLKEQVQHAFLSLALFSLLFSCKIDAEETTMNEAGRNAKQLQITQYMKVTKLSVLIVRPLGWV